MKQRSLVQVPEGHTGDRGQYYNGKGQLNLDGSPKQKQGRTQGSNVDSDTGYWKGHKSCWGFAADSNESGTTNG